MRNKRLKVNSMTKLALVNVKVICPKGHLLVDEYDKKEGIIIDLQDRSIRGFCSKCDVFFNIPFER